MSIGRDLGGQEFAAGGAGAAPEVLQADGAERLVVPGGRFLLVADYGRSGPDLVLSDGDAPQVVVRDFFAADQPPDLFTEGGQRVDAALAGRLAGPAAPAQYAQAGAAGGGADSIGSVEAVSGQVTAAHADGTSVTLSPGDPVFQGDTIETGAGAGISITFADDTTFALEENARMTLDEYVFTPDDASLGISVLQGVFGFVSGQIAKTGEDKMTITTPVATLGMRGTAGAGRAAVEGEQNFFTVLDGIIAVFNDGGLTLLDTPSASTQVVSFFASPAIAEILSPDQLAQQIGARILTAVQTVIQQRVEQHQQQQQQEEAPADGEDGGTDGTDGEDGGTDGAPADGDPGDGDGVPADGEGEPGDGEGDPDATDSTDGTPGGDAADNLTDEEIAQLLGIEPAAGPADGDGGDGGSDDGAADDGAPVTITLDLSDILPGTNASIEIEVTLGPEGGVTGLDLIGVGSGTDGNDGTGSTTGAATDDDDSGEQEQQIQQGQQQQAPVQPTALTLIGGTGSDTLTGGAFGDTLSGGGGADTLLGAGGGDTLTGGTGADSLDGGAGADRILWADGDGSDSIDGGLGTDTVVVTGAAGGNSFSLTDNAGAARLVQTGGATLDMTGVEELEVDGGAGVDSLTVGDLSGTDITGNSVTFSGDAGNDTLDASAATLRVVGDGDAGDDVLTGGSAGDVLSGDAGNDSLVGNDGNDTLDGGTGGDTLLGGEATDTLLGGAGADLLDGGGDKRVLFGTFSGRALDDVADYGQDTGAVSVDLLAARAIDGSGATDTIINIEQVIGSAAADTLTGGSIVNPDENGGGKQDDGDVEDEEVFIGGAGNDTLDGRAGFDRADYRTSTAAVTANLATGTATDGLGGTDTLIDIEALAGSDQADTLTGDGETNLLIGRGGDDTLDGAAGVDGADYLFSGATGGIVVDLANGTVADGQGGTDTLLNIEVVRGTEFDDSFTGGAGADEFRGVAGNDSFDGGAGSDTVVYEEADIFGGSGVSVDLAAGSATNGFGGSDSLTSIENVVGTDFDDTLSGDANDNYLDAGDGVDIVVGGAGNDVLDGSQDNLDGLRQFFDTADYSADTAAIDVNLGAGRGLDGFGGTDVLMGIERLVGSAFDDTLTGGADDGFEEFDGGAGNDTIDGGSGFDQVSYQSETAAVTVDLEAGTGIGTSAGTDILSNIESVEGSEQADTLSGTSGGDDRFRPRGGADVVDGRGGADEVDYSFSNASTGVVVDLGAGTGIDPTGATDSLISIERVRGTNLADTLTGSSADNRFRGMGGNDTFDGNGGTDEVDYSSAQSLFSTAQSGVSVDLAAGTARDGFGATDTLIDIDNLRGSALDDTLEGNSGSNLLDGGDGVDVLVGGAGNDTLDGGDDRVNNIRQFFDSADYSASTGAVSANLATGQATDGLGGSDTLLNIERLVGSASADTLVGGNTANDGFEEFDGRGGSDSIDGGSGFDQVSYQFDTAGVSVDLSTGLGFDSFGGTDTLTGIEAIEGSEQGDTLVGGLAANDDFERFRPRGGADSIDGGSGFDEVDYHFSGAATGVVVNLGTGVAIDHTGATDSLVNIEAVRGSEQADTLTGDGNDNRFRGMAGRDTIDGAGGTDTVDYGNLPSLDGSANRGAYVDLGAGFGRDAAGDVDTLANIENVIGTQDQDTLIGDSGSNVLEGGDNTDVLVGGGGNDTLDGGADLDNNVRQFFDTADYSDDPAAVSADLGQGSARDGFGATDTLIGIERLIGSAGNDTLIGGADDGFEEFDGRGGDDTIDGGTGFDQASYQFDPGGVTVDLAAGTARDGFGGTDTLLNIDSVEGSEFADTLIGGNPALDGFERFRPRGGADTIDGGSGFDEVDYLFSNAQAGILVDLANNLAVDHTGATDTLLNIEAVRATLEDDTLIGSAGDDRFRALEGNDTIDGGAGFDEVDYSDAGANFGQAQQGVVVDLAAGTGRDPFGTVDRLSNIEQVRGTAFGDDIRGDGQANLLEGRTGNDTLVGAGGADTLAADAGDDTLDGGTGADTLIGGAGNDTLDGGAGADTLDGGGGNDTLIVDDSGDVVSEAAGGGTDTVQASVAHTLASEVENLTLTGSADISGTGNSAANTIIGNSGANTLVGGGGADTLTGGDGADRFAYAAAGDGASTSIDGTPSALNLQADTITDFASGTDKITFDGAAFGFAAGTQVQNGVNFFIIGGEYNGSNAGAGGGEAGGTAARIVVDGNGKFIVDQNGDSAGYDLLATVQGDQVQAADVDIT